MTITIHISTRNAAFEDDRDGEVARILREYLREATRLGVQRLGAVTLQDVNGNTVGSVRVRGA